MRQGFLRLAAVAPEVSVGNVGFNISKIKESLVRLDRLDVEIAVFPELSLTGYTCADLFHQQPLLTAAESGIEDLVEFSRELRIDFAVGVPVPAGSAVYNCAAFIGGGSLKALVAKSFLPNYNEFYERRWFSTLPVDVTVPMRFAGVDITMGSRQVTDSHGTLVGIEICEDLWVPRPPSTDMALRGAEIILNLSASNDLIGKYAYLKRLIEQQSGSLFCAYAYAGAGFGESSTDLIFDGKAMIAECGSMRKTSERFSINGVEAIADVDVEALRRDRIHTTSWADSCSVSKVRLPLSEDSDEVTDLKFREVDPRPFVPDGPARDERCNDIFNMQSLGLSRRLDAIGCRQAVVGISGGLDSTLALLVTVEAFDRLGLGRKGIVGVTMPGFGTTDRTHDNAVKLMEYLGISHREISIVPAVKQHFEDIGHDPSVHDVTYENAQARQRTYLLMDIANACGGIVIGTGDLSELALGWATYNGDHMSMYGVNSGVPKTLVRYLVEWYAVTKASEPVGKVLADVLSTPVSPELLPPDENGDIAQKTEDVVGPYELHDFFLYYTLRYGFSPERIFLLAGHAFSPETYPASVIKKWMRVFFRRFFAQQFKRSCLPDGPKIGSVCLSPRGDWRMPSDVSAAAWIASLDRM